MSTRWGLYSDQFLRQDFYEEQMNNEFRWTRFWELAKKEGMTYAKFERQMHEKKVALLFYMPVSNSIHIGLAGTMQVHIPRCARDKGTQ